MKYGLDVLNPPLRAWSINVRDLGWSWLNVYVGGPRCAALDRWRQQDGIRYPVRELADVFDGFLPTYVGRNYPWDGPETFTYDQGRFDGDDANDCTGACGFDRPTPLCLDLEYGCWQNYGEAVVEYVRGWVQSVNEAGHKAGAYSDIDTLNQLPIGELVDFKWGAAWIRNSFTNRAPTGRFDPTFPPPWDAWQYGGGILLGASVDCNSMVDTFELARYGPY